MWLRFLRDSSRTRERITVQYTKSARIQLNSLYAQVKNSFISILLLNVLLIWIRPNILTIWHNLWFTIVINRRFPLTFSIFRRVSHDSRNESRAESSREIHRKIRSAHTRCSWLACARDARTDAASWATAWSGDHSRDFPRTTTHDSNLLS